jgi:uncharacterized protein (DUF58 family)
MDKLELIKKVRKIEIRTKGLSKNIFSGEYHSAFKGKGMAFSEVREYQYGDDIRAIDWNVTSRFNHPYVKIFDEERELNVILLVDLSQSGSFGSNMQLKRELITEICAVLAFSSLQNNDKIGIVFFSDKVEKFIPPKKGRTHVLRIISDLIDFHPENTGTDISNALQFAVNVIKKKSIFFIISDFLSKDFSEPLKISGKKHDTIAVQIFDKRESSIPDIGLIELKDLETNYSYFSDTSSVEFRRNYELWWSARQSELERLFYKNKIDLIKLETDISYISPLMNFFKKRGNRH